MADRLEQDCFGFYTGGGVCAACAASKRCKAILVSDGFTVMAETIHHIVGELPSGNYKDSDRIPEIVDQLLAPPRDHSKERGSSPQEEELLSLVDELFA